MAAISISGWPNSDGRKFTLTVTEQSSNPKTNKSIVAWTLTVSNSSYNMDTYVKCTVAGSVVYNVKMNATDDGGWTWNGFPTITGSASGTVEVTHNSDGTKAISFAIEGYAVTYTPYYNNGSLNLTTLDRTAPSVGLSVTGFTKDSISISATSSANSNSWDYRLNSGSWINFSTTNGTSATKTITGLSMNTLYTIDVRAKKTSNDIYGYSPAVDQKTLGAAEISMAADLTLGTACNIKWTPLDSTHKFKLTFTVGSVSNTTGLISPASTSAYTYTGYTPTVAAYAPAITTSKTGSMSVILTTYLSDGTTVVGSDTKLIVATVPDSTKPTVSTLTLAQGSTKSGFTNVAGGELCVKSLSTLAATATSGGQYGAKVVSVSIVIIGKTYTASVPDYNTSTTTTTVTSDILTSSGTLSISATATDSRGYVSVAKTATVYVADYFKPSGTITYAINGTSIDTNVTWKIAPVADSANKPVNTGSVVITRKKISTSATASYTVKSIAASTSSSTTAVSNYTGSGSWSASTQALSDGNSETYEYTVTITDKKGSSYAATYVISTGVVAASYLGGGKGLTLFTEAADEGFWAMELTTKDMIKYDISKSAYLTIANLLATPYTTNKSWFVGEFTKYNSALYKANVNVPSGETWTASHWTAIT